MGMAQDYWILPMTDRVTDSDSKPSGNMASQWPCTRAIGLREGFHVQNMARADARNLCQRLIGKRRLGPTGFSA